MIADKCRRRSINRQSQSRVHIQNVGMKNTDFFHKRTLTNNVDGRRQSRNNLQINRRNNLQKNPETVWRNTNQSKRLCLFLISSDRTSRCRLPKRSAYIGSETWITIRGAEGGGGSALKYICTRVHMHPKCTCTQSTRGLEVRAKRR